MKPQIRIVDTAFKHSNGGSFGTGDLCIKPTHFDWVWSDKQIGDIVVITESCIDLVDSLSEMVKILLILEPEKIMPDIYRRIREPKNYSKFTHILTHDKNLIKLNKEKFIYYSFGGCWIEPTYRATYVKKMGISTIVSSKRITPSHIMRHDAIANFKDEYEIDVFGRGYNPISNKIDALKNYKFSLTIENDNSDGWFTEKLIDCFQTGTIPIYYGNKCVFDIFNKNGFLFFENLDELRSELIKIKYGAFKYENRMDAVYDNFERSKKFIIPEDNIWRDLLGGLHNMLSVQDGQLFKFL